MRMPITVRHALSVTPLPMGRFRSRCRLYIQRNLRPVLSLEGPVAGDDRDAALRQIPGQRRAPARAVEDQCQGRLARVRRGEIRRLRRQHAERLRPGEDIRLQSVHSSWLQVRSFHDWLEAQPAEG